MDLDGINYVRRLQEKRKAVLANASPAVRARILGERPSYYTASKPAPKPRPVVVKPAAPAKKQSVEAIIEAVLDATGTSRYEFFREGRCRDVVGRARQLAYWLVCRFRPDMSWPAKGRLFQKHHTTVMGGYWRFEQIRNELPVSRWIQHPLLIDLVEAASKEVGTPSVSSFKRSLKDRARPFKGRRHGETHPEAKMTTEQVLAIRADPRSSKEVALAFGMSRSGIKDIRSRKTWKHI
ncbi:MAG: hypothetical protein ACOVKO_01875 [Elstera sp.]|jgi:hypothetical protein